MENNQTNFAIDKEKFLITVTRTFDAPRPMIWAAMTDSALIPLWWGPERLTTIVEKNDLSVGGEWRFVHHDEDGHEYGFHGITKEIVPLEKVVQTFNFEGIPPGHELIQTMILEDADGGRTKLTQRAQYKNIEDLEGMVQSGMESGLREGLERLARLASSKKELMIVHVFDAPRELVWKAWTDETLMAQWWGPTGFTNPRCELDVKPGGAIHIDMQPPGGPASPMGGVFKEVVPPERLVFTSTAFYDEHGENPQLENLNTVTFEEENGKTKMTVHVVVQKSGPATEIALYGMEMGWQQSIDKLRKLVSQ